MPTSLIMRKTHFGNVDSSLVQSYQSQVSALSVNAVSMTDGSSNYLFDNNNNFLGQYNGIISFCNDVNDASLVTFINTMINDNPSIDMFTYSQNINFGI